MGYEPVDNKSILKIAQIELHVNYAIITKMFENLKILGKDYTWLEKEARKFKIKPEDALLMTIDGKQEIFCQAKEKKK